jgi:dsDNA-specific endonuclease/ATPase MutS2
MMKLLASWLNWWHKPNDLAARVEPDLTDEDDAADPFDEPVQLEITDVIDLHAIPPKQVKAVVEEYLFQAQARGFRYARIIHGKGHGVQRELVRKLLARTRHVKSFYDAPPEAGGWGATIVEFGESDTQ